MSSKAKKIIGHECINADLVDTPIIICDINDRIIYKNNSAYLCDMPRMNANITVFLSKGDVERYMSVKERKSICESVNLLLKDDEITGYICNYKTYSTEMFLIFPKSASGFKGNKHACNFRKFIAELAKNTEYGYMVCKKQRRVLTGARLIRNNNILCSTQIMTMSRGSFMKLSDMSYIISEFMTKELRFKKCRVIFSDDNADLTVNDPEIFITAFLDIMISFMSDNNRKNDIFIKQKDENVFIDALISSDIRPAKEYKNISELSAIFPEHKAELMVLSFLCEEFGWQFSFMPYYTPPFNIMVSLSCKTSKRKNMKVRECSNCDTKRIAYMKFLGYLMSDKK